MYLAFLNSRAMTKDKIIILLLLGGVICLLSAKQEHERGSAVFHDHEPVYVLGWNGTSAIMTEEQGRAVSSGAAEPPAHLKPLFFQPIPINESDYELLLTIPGVGPATAKEIIKTRMAEYGFGSAEDLLRVHGIGAKKKEYLRQYVTF